VTRLGRTTRGSCYGCAGNVYATGRTSHTIPTTTGTFQSVYNGGSYDAYVVKVAPTAATTTTLVVAPASVTAGQTVTLTATVAVRVAARHRRYGDLP